MAAVRSATSFVSASVLLARSMIVALPDSTAASSASISSLRRVRVTLLLPISVSQNPSWSASSFASSRRRVIIPSMSFFTLANGSAAILSARAESPWLFNLWPSCWRKSRTLLRMPCARASALERESAWMRATGLFLDCASVRYLSAAPATSGEDRISTAFSIASISSARSFCFSWKDKSFWTHSVCMSLSSFSLASFMDSVAVNCLLLAPALASLRCI
mmetsp:Transcript_113304/g.307677  ORF Transcript_113304/g.307677 Transcript_113304/m.307677 type:complete len:219 (-) Transcript_113304:884-1540(-)